MTEGTLDIFWENNFALSGARKYHVRFAPYSGEERGAMPLKYVVGEQALLQYLVELFHPSMDLERREKQTHQWMLELQSNTTLSLPNFQLTDQQAREFSRIG
jgi:hypothetical protein